jgi:pimeloyl-ACP methyl ester carboxylesterase
MALIRENAEAWAVDPERIAVIGFSAGGHLAACAATMAEHRPNAAILGYPVIDGDCVHDYLPSAPDVPSAVDARTCPCFVFATRTDNLVPASNALHLLGALWAHDIAFESHIYANGPHGLTTGDPSVNRQAFSGRYANWVEDSIAWLRDLFGDFGNDGLTQPMCRPHVTDDAMAWLSLDCTIARIFGNPRAREILAPTIEKMRAKILPFTPEMTFEDMMVALGKMTLRALLVEREIDIDLFPQLEEALNKVPNI